MLNDILRYVGDGEGEEGAGHLPPAPSPALEAVADAEAAPALVLANGTVSGDNETVPREQGVLQSSISETFFRSCDVTYVVFRSLVFVSF